MRTCVFWNHKKGSLDLTYDIQYHKLIPSIRPQTFFFVDCMDVIVGGGDYDGGGGAQTECVVD